MKNNRIYTPWNLYQIIEKLEKEQNVKVAFDTHSTKVFTYLDQTYFLEFIRPHYFFRFDRSFNQYVCVNTINKIKVTI